VRTIRLSLAYDGTSFRGWAAQRDPAIRTVQGELTAVLSAVLREPVALTVAGRTDAGVHARGQVASFRTESALACDRIQAAVNGHLGPEVVCLAAAHAPGGFDARFSATARAYRYRIHSGPVPDPFTACFEWHRPGELDIRSMRAGAAQLVGEHDFTSFCRHPGAGKPTARNLQRLTIGHHGDRWELAFRANAFLHQMVRALTGALVMVGEGKLDPDAIPAILAARDRAGVPGNLAPAKGLTLERVIYGGRSAAPARAQRTSSTGQVA
jgi:tRNA pseudouridine38-40 synthase